MEGDVGFAEAGLQILEKAHQISFLNIAHVTDTQDSAFELILAAHDGDVEVFFERGAELLAVDALW
jgi:hypothetical protein